MHMARYRRSVYHNILWFLVFPEKFEKFIKLALKLVRAVDVCSKVGYEQCRILARQVFIQPRQTKVASTTAAFVSQVLCGVGIIEVIVAVHGHDKIIITMSAAARYVARPEFSRVARQLGIIVVTQELPQGHGHVSIEGITDKQDATQAQILHGAAKVLTSH